MVRVWAGFCLGGLHPLIHCPEEVGIGPSRAAWHSLPLQSTPTAKGRREEGGEARAPCRLPCAPCDIVQSGTAIHSQLKSTVYEAPGLSAQPGMRVSLRGAPAPPSPSPDGSFCHLRGPHPAFLRPPPAPGFMCPGAASIRLQRSRASRAPWGGEGKRVDFPKASEDAGSSRGPSVWMWVSQPCRSPWTTSEA